MASSTCFAYGVSEELALYFLDWRKIGAITISGFDALNFYVSLFLQYTLLDASIILLPHAITIHIEHGLEQP
uniref:Uncharacterized protein n=1 Tax=Salix viminalis TaxID=40686 RepID=A0A6N2N4N0_SALVM